MLGGGGALVSSRGGGILAPGRGVVGRALGSRVKKTGNTTISAKKLVCRPKRTKKGQFLRIQVFNPRGYKNKSVIPEYQ